MSIKNFREKTLSNFGGLQIDGNDKINIPKLEEATNSVSLFIKRVFASEDERGKNKHVKLYRNTHKNDAKILFNIFIDIKVVNVSSQIETSTDTRPFLIDCTASCFKSKEKYFSTEIEEQPWLLFDFQEQRIMYGVRAFLRVDGGARDLTSRQSK